VAVALRPLGFAALNSVEADPVELAEAAARAGFSAISARLSPADLPDGRRYGSGSLVLTKSRLDELGVDVLEVEIARLRPETSRDDLESLVDGAALLGAPYLNTIGDYPEEERISEELARLDEICSSRGVRPVLEFMHHSQVKTLAQALRIVTTAGVRSPALLVDSLHLARSGGTPADVATLDPSLMPYAHICDARMPGPTTIEDLRAEARGGRLLPGHGGLSLLGYIGALPPAIPLIVEVPGATAGTLDEQAGAAFRATNELLARFQ
jgi:sugar phosphate isomerase/epimerase